MAPVIESELRTRRWRRVEYERLVELGVFTGEHLELLEGLLVVREPEDSSHAAIVDEIGRVLTAGFGDGWYARHHAPLALGEHSEPEPDVAIVAGRPRDYLAAHPSTAALVVEVANSSLRLDRRFKAGIYAGAGLPEYWIVNLAEGSVEVHRDPQPSADEPDAWSYRGVETFRPPATITPLSARESPVSVADLLP